MLITDATNWLQQGRTLAACDGGSREIYKRLGLWAFPHHVAEALERQGPHAIARHTYRDDFRVVHLNRPCFDDIRQAQDIKAHQRLSEAYLTLLQHIATDAPQVLSWNPGLGLRRSIRRAACSSHPGLRFQCRRDTVGGEPDG